MLLPIKLATGKQPAKKQKVQKDLGLVITPEMQKNIEATNPQGIVERAKQIEAVRAEQEQFAQRTKQGQAQLAYEQTLKQAAQQPKQAKAFVPKLQELEKQISPPPISREVIMQKRVPKTPEGLATISILTDYGTTTYTATPEETQILEFGTIDEGAALRNRLRQEAQAEFASQGLKKKRQTAEAYVTDKVNAALNPNFVNDQVAETLRAELDDTIFDFAAKYSPGGKLLKTGRDALKSASAKLKSVDDVGAQVTAGLIDSIINPVSSFATATANVYDPTATQEERVGAAGNIALYALGALPVTEALGASVRAFKTGADVAEGLSLAARSLLKSTAPGRFIDRKVTINDLVNVLERNGQMGGKTRGQLAKEFASGGKAFAKATGQAPELFYNKYLNDLADQAQPATPAQFDVTAPKTPEAPTQVEDLGTVVDDLVGKTKPVVTEPTVTPVVETPVTPPTSIVDEIEQGMGASKSTATPPPAEPTVTGIPETPDEQFTSAKNRMTQEVRDEYNMSEFDEPTRRAWEESLTTAKQELQSNANAVDNVIAKIDSKRAINEAEQSVLVVALSRERRNARALLEQTNNATSPEEIATLAEQTKIAEGRIDSYTNALNKAGSETARTLNARRAIIDTAEDLVSIRAKARQTYGKALEVADEEAINEIGKGLEDINKQIDDATGKGTIPVETAKANTRVKNIKESAPKLQPKADAKRVQQFESVVNRVKEKLDAFVRPSTIETMGAPTEVDIWQPRLNDPASQAYFKQLASVQNDMGKVIQKLVTDEAIEDFDTLLTRLQSDGFNITDTDLKLILSADYPTTKLYDFSDIEKEYVKMVRRQLEQEAKGSSVAERGRLIKNIQKLSQKVQSNARKVTDKTLKTAFEENIDLQNRLDDLQAESNVKGQIDKLKEQIADPVLVDRIKREVPQYIQDLVHQREILRGQLNDKLRELADKKFREEHPYLNALEVAAKVPTELLVSLDNSAAFTHGAFRSIRNPLKWTKATSKSFQALISDGKYKDILASVRTRDNYDDMVRAGVAGIKQRDLQDATMYASVLQKVPYVGSLFKRSNAAMEVFGAVIRSDYFDALTEASRKEYLRGKITRSELLDRYKLQAEFVNTVTGKGIKELPRPVSVIAPFANFGMSRIKTATMTPFFNAIAKGDKVAARQFATEYFKYASTYMGLLKIAEMNGLEVGIDPRNPEYFGKIKLPGVDKWWDMSGGILEPYRILINTKPVRNITGAEESKYKTITNFAEGKLGAPAKTAMNVFQGMTGETPYGRNYDVRTDEGRLNVLMDNLPINVKTGKELVETDKSFEAKTAEAGLQFMGARLTKDKGSKARQPVTPGVTP